MIFGRGRKALLYGKQPANVPCGHCGQKALLPLVIQRYLHVFWIPFVPTRKVVYFECEHCKRTEEHLPGQRDLDVLAQAAKASARAPLYLYAGVALFVVLLGVGALKSRADARDAKAWVAAPAVGDVYVINAAKAVPEAADEDFKYVVARVGAVTPDGVEVRVGSVGYRSSSGANKAIREGDVRQNNYLSPDPVQLSRAQLQTWLADGSLSDVVRE